MATVVDKGRPTAPTDKKLSSPNRRNAGSPVGSVTPLYAGEIIFDTTDNKLWRAEGITSGDWLPAIIEG